MNPFQSRRTFLRFRRKRSSPPGYPSRQPEQIAIPLNVMPTVGYAVFFRPDGEQVSQTTLVREMHEMTRNWLETHCDNPLREILQDYLSHGFFQPEIEHRENVPELPEEMLRAYNPGREEERRFREATHVVFVTVTDFLLSPRPGFWATLAMARALTQNLPGAVMVDPEFPRLLPLTQAQESLPGDTRVYLMEHILIPYSLDASTHLAWMTTKGMHRFGLPNLEIADVPAHLAGSLTPLINGVAQRLAQAANRFLEENIEAVGAEPPEEFRHPAEFTITQADLRRAYVPEPLSKNEEVETVTEEAHSDRPVRHAVLRQEALRELPHEPRFWNSDTSFPEEGNWHNLRSVRNDRPDIGIAGMRLRLEMRSLSFENNTIPLIGIVPPASSTERMGEWLHRALGELFAEDEE